MTSWWYVVPQSMSWLGPVAWGGLELQLRSPIWPCVPTLGERHPRAWGGGEGNGVSPTVLGYKRQNLTHSAADENGALSAYVKAQRGVWVFSPNYL